MLQPLPLLSTLLTRGSRGFGEARVSSIGVRVAPEPLQEGLLYAFLPTEHSTGLPLHINADFFPESDRKAVIFKGHQHGARMERDADRRGGHRARTRSGRATRNPGQRAVLAVAQRRIWAPVQTFWTSGHLQAVLGSTEVGLRERPDCSGLRMTVFAGRTRRFCLTVPPSHPLKFVVLRELGGHVAIDSLQTHRNAMNQLGAQILTFDRLLNFIQGGLSALKAGESQVTPERVETFYKPLWMMLGELLPEQQSAAMASAVQRLKALPAIVSEDLYCVTISQSYAAPSSLDSARVAELLPRLSIASRGLGATPRILSLVATLDLAGVVTHLSELAQDNSLADGGIGLAPKDLKDLYNLFADLDVGQQTNESVCKGASSAPSLAVESRVDQCTGCPAAWQLYGPVGGRRPARHDRAQRTCSRVRSHETRSSYAVD